MKSKMKYFYGGLFVLIVLGIWITAGSEKTNENRAAINKAGKITLNSKTPQDEIHSKLSAGKVSPTKDNVSKNFIHEMDVLKKHIDTVPKDTTSIKKYAELLFTSHKPAEAIVYFNRILKIDKKRRDILFDVIFAFFNLKNFSKAKFYTKKILQYYPNNLSAQYNLGAIYASEGKRDSAARIWEKIIKNAPNSHEANLAQSSLKRLNN